MLRRWFNRMIEQRATQRRRRHEALVLARLEDHLLADIGLRRHHVNRMLASATGENQCPSAGIPGRRAGLTEALRRVAAVRPQAIRFKSLSPRMSSSRNRFLLSGDVH